MKKVKNVTAISFLHNEILWAPGDVLTVSDVDAEHFALEGFEIVGDHIVESNSESELKEEGK